MKVFRVVWLVLANTQPVRHQQKQASIEEWWGRARGGSGNPFGNAKAESFMKTLKVEASISWRRPRGLCSAGLSA